jgi:peptide/nickel transport system permease protein
MIPTLIVVSMITFFLIQLPPGDFLTTYIANLAQSGETVDEAEIAALQHRYGLDQPMYVQYVKWITGVVQGDFGVSFTWNQPVSDLIWGRLGTTLLISIAALIINWLVAFPIGIYSAIRQYSIGDYIFTFMAFTSSAIPHFLIALVLMYLIFKYTGYNITGFYGAEFGDQPWNWPKIADTLKHLAVAVGILGFLGGAHLIRTMRANLLDELKKPYVSTARAKGLSEGKVIMKYPVRVALNPFISSIGWTLPALLSGTTITAIVLGMPTTGPLLLTSLRSQDMYLAGSFVLILSFLTIIGTFISDMLLAWLDPRIRFQ